MLCFTRCLAVQCNLLTPGRCNVHVKERQKESEKWERKDTARNIKSPKHSKLNIQMLHFSASESWLRRAMSKVSAVVSFSFPARRQQAYVKPFAPSATEVTVKARGAQGGQTLEDISVKLFKWETPVLMLKSYIILAAQLFSRQWGKQSTTHCSCQNLRMWGGLRVLSLAADLRSCKWNGEIKEQFKCIWWDGWSPACFVPWGKER